MTGEGIHAVTQVTQATHETDVALPVPHQGQRTRRGVRSAAVPALPPPPDRIGGAGSERAPLIAAIDIGGTKIAGALLDSDGAVLHQVRRRTPASAPSEEVLRAVYDVIDALAAHQEWGRVDRLGIGSAGPVHVDRGAVSPVNIPAWREFPLLDRVGAHLAAARLPVTLVGDAVAMAAGEHWRGAARGFANALCLVVSTGVGAGLVLDGAVRMGPTGNAGHLGHICVDVGGELCACGARGCLEGFASGPAIVRYALAAGWQPRDGMGAGSGGGDGSGDGNRGGDGDGDGGGGDGDDAGLGEDVGARNRIGAAAVAESARAGDPAAAAAFDRAARALAAGIAAVAALVEIEVAVVGGGVAQSGEVLFAPLRRHLRDYAVLPFTLGIEVRPAQLGGQAGLAGVAALALAR